MSKILVIDDDLGTLSLVRTILEDEGYEVVTVENGETGIEKSQSEDFDLVILDIMMPRTDGFQVCHRLRISPTTASIPVIMLTAWGYELNRERAEILGVKYFLIKPFLPEELLDCVRKALPSSG